MYESLQVKNIIPRANISMHFTLEHLSILYFDTNKALQCERGLLVYQVKYIEQACNATSFNKYEPNQFKTIIPETLTYTTY